MITPSALYDKSGTFGLNFKGTAAQLAAVPDGRWTPAEGDLWYDTTNDILKIYNGSSWVQHGAAQTAVSAEHGAGSIGTALAPATYRRTENGIIITEIKIDLTGLKSKDTANDVIGLAAGGAAYIGRNVVATNGIIYRAEMACLETPAGGDDDINLVAGSAATNAYDDAVTNAAVILNAGDQTAGMTTISNIPHITANYYLYLTAGTGDTAVVYTAGMFLVRLYGHALLA